MRHQEVAEKFFSKVLKRSRILRFCGHCILKNTDLSTACYSNMGQNMGQIVWYQIALNYSELLDIKTKEKVPKSYNFRTFYGCGGRTRTYDLRVMSPTSYQLLYSAIFYWHFLSACILYHRKAALSRQIFSTFFTLFIAEHYVIKSP